MIEVVSLRKQFGEIIAVDGVTFTAESGAIFGLLGPNGAGKTTTIGCIAGLLAPGSGRIRVRGHDVVTDGPASRRRLGIVPQEIALYEDLSARENLHYWGSAYGLRGPGLDERIAAALDLVGLADRAGEPVKRYSGGMKRRLNFACGIVHGPEVLLLDEPTVGVDPQSRVRILDLVRQQAGAGVCVLYTTHYMEEAEALCDRIAIMDHGRVIATGSVPELRAMLGERDLLRLIGRFEPNAAIEAMARLEAVEVVQAEADVLVLALPAASTRLPALFDAVGGSGGEIRETILSQPNLESLFIKLTGKELRE